MRRIFEAPIKVNLEWFEKTMRYMKQVLVGKNLGNKDIENILNIALQPHGVIYIQSDGRKKGSRTQQIVGLVSGGITNEKFIFIEYNQLFYQTFENDVLWDDFIIASESILYHELVHRGQLSRAKIDKLKKVDMTTIETYLSDKHEIMAFAEQAVFDLHALGITTTRIAQMLKTNDHGLNQSEAYYQYYATFGVDYDPKYISSPYDWVWEQFLTTMYASLSL